MIFNRVRGFKCLIIIILPSLCFFQAYFHIYLKETLIKPLSSPTATEFEELSHTLEPFTMHLPHFIDDKARDWFLNSTYYRMYSNRCPNNDCLANGFLFDDLHEHRSVHIYMVKNGLYENDDCGFRYGDVAIRRTFSAKDYIPVLYDQAIIYTVPDGWAFQHFLDGVGPKLSHSYPYLYKYPRAKVLIMQGFLLHRSVKEIWEMLGKDMTSNKILINLGDLRCQRIG